MAPRPPIQAVIEEQAELDEGRRNWRMVLFNEDGTPFSGGEGGAGAVEEIDDLAYASGWAPHSSGNYEGVTRHKIGRKVTLSGTAECAGGKAADSVIGTLPEGWRPEKKVMIPAPSYDGSGFQAHARAEVHPNGNVVLAQVSLGAFGWIPIQGSFIVAEEVIGIS